MNDELEPETRGGHRADRRPEHLPERHARLDGRDLAPHVAAGAPHHDEREGGHGAHQAQQRAGEEHLRQGAGERHEEEAEPLEPLDRERSRASGRGACTSRPEIGAVTTVTSGLMPRIQPVQRSVVAASNGDISWM